MTTKKEKVYRGNYKIFNQQDIDRIIDVTVVDGFIEVYGSIEFRLPALTDVTGYLRLEQDAKGDFPALTKTGDLILEQDAKGDFPALTDVTGYLRLEQDAKGDFPALTKTGYLRLAQDAKGDFPALTDVTGYLRLAQDAKGDFPALTKTGYLILEQDAKGDFPALTDVTGYLILAQDAKGDFPALTDVTGYLILEQDAKGDFPALTDVTGYLILAQDAKGDFPALTDVTGYLRLAQDAKGDFPALTKTGYLRLEQDAKGDFPALTKTGYLRLDAKLSPQNEQIIIKSDPAKWYLGDHCSDTIVAAAPSDRITYTVDNLEISALLFERLRNGTLSPADVFGIRNTETRRAMYGRLDKSKMGELNPTVLDEDADDGHGYPMRVIEVSVDNFNTPFRYLNCFCPSTGREYWIETRQTECWAAKAVSFGMPTDIKFDAEY